MMQRIKDYYERMTPGAVREAFDHRRAAGSVCRAWPAAALWIACVSGACVSGGGRAPCARAAISAGTSVATPTPPRTAPPEQPARPPPSAVERLAAIRAELEQLRAGDPEPDHGGGGGERVERASVFSINGGAWSGAVRADYTLRRPVGTLAKRRWIDRRRAAVAETLAAQTRRRGLFYLFAAPERCPDCAAFATILQSFAAKTGIAVVAVSADGATDPAFPDALADRGRIARLGLGGRRCRRWSCDAAAGKTTPVGFGLLTEDQLAGAFTP